MSLPESAIPQVGLRAVELNALSVDTAFASNTCMANLLMSHKDHTLLVRLFKFPGRPGELQGCES